MLKGYLDLLVKTVISRFCGNQKKALSNVIRHLIQLNYEVLILLRTLTVTLFSLDKAVYRFRHYIIDF